MRVLIVFLFTNGLYNHIQVQCMSLCCVGVAEAQHPHSHKLYMRTTYAYDYI